MLNEESQRLIDRVWTRLYPADLDPTPRLVHQNIPEAWRARVGVNPDRPAIRYFDGTLSAADVDAASDAIAVAMEDRGTRAGDRVGIYLQNVPHNPITLLAIWKLGAVAVPLNPMYRNTELRKLVDDAGIVGMVADGASLEDLHGTLTSSTVRWVLTASDRDFQTRNDPRVVGTTLSAPAPEGDLGHIIRDHDGRRPSTPPLDPDSLAFITYTSGTTGPPKGALNSHGNFLHSVMNYTAWVQLVPGDVVFAIAPLFHITGISLNAGIALLSDTTLVLAGRFHPEVTITAIAEHGVTFTIGSITAFNAMLKVPWANADHFRSVKHFYSGGAPIPPSTITTFRERFGPYLHNVWGMTETTGGGLAVPPGIEAPVHAASGTLSVGVPMQNADVRVIDADGNTAQPGVEGELEFDAPQVVAGYWQNPSATTQTFPGGRLRTGDVAVMDEDGWVYLVDRLKDLINTSGFKVWPREVEDALYEHPAVFEAAVVGEPDPYRGENVVAYVSLVAGASTEAAELVAFVRERLAAYKVPRRITFVDELPKTATGKIRRKDMRDAQGTVERRRNDGRE